MDRHKETPHAFYGYIVYQMKVLYSIDYYGTNDGYLKSNRVGFTSFFTYKNKFQSMKQ